MNLSNQTENIINRQRVVDFDIQSIVGIRLINPTAEDEASVEKQLGPFQGCLDRNPDIVIHFRNKLLTPKLKYLDLDYSAFTDDGFYVFKNGRKVRKVQIPFEKIGGECEILCESNVGAIPMLNEIINLTLLRKGYIPLHASAFRYNGNCILAMGWTKGGKTEALLSFANHGAQYIGDELLVLSGDGEEMFGLPVPICLWHWQFKYIPNLVPKIGTQRKILFKCIYLAEKIFYTFRKKGMKNSFWIEILEKALPIIKRQLKIMVLPQDIFKNQYCKSKVNPDKIFLMMSHNKPEIKIEPCNPVEIARRMASSHVYEQLELIKYYNAFKFAFPSLKNEFLENIGKLQNDLLCRAFRGKTAYKVLHPYPTAFEDLFNQLKPLCRQENINAS